MVRKIIPTFICVLISLSVGFGCGIWFAPQFKSTQSQLLATIAAKIPMAKALAKTDKDSPYELYDYPTIKWHAKPLGETAGAIAQLWTRYEKPDQTHPAGRVNYRLTVFKAPDKGSCEVQLLDETGFKILQFDAADFHQIPGSSDIMEARDSNSCSEDDYKRIRDYSIK